MKEKSKPLIKQQKFTLKAKQPKKIKAALNAWVASSEKTECDPLNLNGAPVWAENALAEVVKIILPSKCLPTSGEIDVELIGELIGRLHAFGKLFGGEIPMGPETKGELDRIEKHAASLPQSPERAAREKVLAKDFAGRVEAVDQSIPQLMSAVLGSSHEDALKFQKGLLRGMNLAPDELTTGKTFQRHTRTFSVLGLQWPLFSKCRSVHEVYRKLCAEIGADKIGSLKAFEKNVAKPIGMKFGRAGRPPKLK